MDLAFAELFGLAPEESVSDRIKREAKARLEAPRKVREVVGTGRNSATRFSTQYAIDWGRKQGWKLVDRERYDYRLKRHHDLMLGADAMFDTADGLVLVQGAGRSERKEHWERFLERGGTDKAQRLRVRFVYVEFERTSKEPVKEEWWC